MVELKNISYSYSKENKILQDINIKIQDGECILLCGRSGCGKTTIGRIINNLIPRFFERGVMSGDVYINNENTKDFEMHELANLIGTVFQNPKAQFFHTNSDAEIVFGLENNGMKPEKIRRRYKEVVDELNIHDLTNRDELLWRWAKRRHPKKGKWWISTRYWHRKGSRNWVFSTDKHELIRVDHTPIVRHTKIKLSANPYLDTEYFTERKFNQGMKRL